MIVGSDITGIPYISRTETDLPCYGKNEKTYAHSFHSDSLFGGCVVPNIFMNITDFP